MSVEPSVQTPKTFIQHLHSLGFLRHRPIATFDEFEVNELDLTPLKLNVSFFIPFIIPKQLTLEQISVSQITDLWQVVVENFSQGQKINILLISGNVDLQKDDARLVALEEKGVVIWDQKAMQAIVGATDLSAKFKLISKGPLDVMGRGSLSPYVSGRPAVGGRFFGRSNQLRPILAEDSNCTILGNRRIGKTSLLKQIKERLKLKGYRTAEVYGATCSSTDDFVIKLLRELDEFQKAQKVERSPYNATSLPRWIKQMAVKTPVAVFVDELDHILEFDAKQNYELMHTLREIFESNAQCRVFFAGFRRVMSERQSLGSPLFNFTKPIELQGFTQEETYEMVTKPLTHLGIEVMNTDLPKDIFIATAGHPEHIQICCAELIKFYEEKDRVPQAPELISRVLDSTEYKQKVLGAFLSNTNPFEELVCYLLIKDARERINEYEFSPANVREMLETYGDTVNHDVKTILGVINNLSVSGIIVNVGGGAQRYRFSSPMLAEYCRAINIDKSIGDALRKVGVNPDLYFTPAVDEQIHITET